MKILLSALYDGGNLNFTHPSEAFDELFTIAKNLKFDGIEYVATIPDMLLKPRKVLALSKEYDVPIISIHAPMHLLIYTPTFLYKTLLKMFQQFPDSEAYNFHLSGFITPLHNGDGNLKKFMEFAKKNNISISFESNPLLKGLGKYPKVTYDPETFAEYCIQQNLSITLDTSHVAHCNYDIVTFFNKYYKHIKLIHLSDSIGSVQHLPLGKGNLPIKELLQEIKKRSYDKLITFEINKFSKIPTIKEKTEEIKRSFDLVKKYIY